MVFGIVNTMNSAPKTLPDNPAALREMVLSLMDEKAVWKDEKVALQNKADWLLEQLNILRKKQFGRSSEKAGFEHPSLFDEAEEEAMSHPEIGDEEDVVEDSVSVSGHTRKKRGRKSLPEGLPRIEVIHDLPEEEKICALDGHALVEIGRETSEQIDIIPAQVQVVRDVRLKYACPHCRQGVKLATLPPRPIPKALATAATLAYVAISKYADALPLYRQEGILARAGIDLPRATLANWMIKVGTLVQPLINLLRDKLLECGIVQMDETTVQVLKEDGKTAASKSYMWVQRGGPSDKPVILFDYDPSRSGKVPIDLLADYKGWLQTDGYAGYLAIGSMAGVEHIGCWAHARRKFVEAATAAGKKKKSKASQAVRLIGKLYAIEKRIRDGDADHRLEIRQKEVPPILKKIREWMSDLAPKVLPSSATGRALAYLHKQWPLLIRYIEDGRLEIDNNLTENAIRPFVVGRKNWLFSNSVAGAKSSANLYSLIETAKANGLEPYAYLRHLFDNIPAAQTIDDFDALLPWNSKKKICAVNPS